MTILNRLRSAEAGNRELDAMIAVSLQIIPRNSFQPCASTDAGTFGTGAHTFWRAPEYTTSIDAALALVEKMLPGWFYRVCPKYCELTHPKYRAKDVDGHGATPALAILTALFTALEAKDTTP